MARVTFGDRISVATNYGYQSGDPSILDRFNQEQAYFTNLNNIGNLDLILFDRKPGNFITGGWDETRIHTSLSTSPTEFESRMVVDGLFWHGRIFNHAPKEMADLNNDGFDDIVLFGAENSQSVTIALGNGDGTFADEVEQQIGFARDRGFISSDIESPRNWRTQDEYPRQLADIDGDGILDIVGISLVSPRPNNTPESAWAKGRGDGFFERAEPIVNLPVETNEDGWQLQSKTPRFFANLNGKSDDADDFIGFKGNSVFTAFSEINGSFDKTTESILLMDDGSTVPAGNQLEVTRLVGDVNGDKQADIVLIDNTQDSPPVFVGLGKGDGTFESLYQLDVGGLRRNIDDDTDEAHGSLRFALQDVDGDGSDDIVGIDDVSAWYALSSGAVADPKASTGCIEGTEGADDISGGPVDDCIRALGGDDRINAHGGNNKVSGGDGNDRVTGGSGNDLLTGDEGDDRIVGENGNDIMDGGGGNDWLSAGLGDDLLTGGSGHDTFVFHEGRGRDVVTDFEVGIDTIRIYGNFDFEDLNFTQIGTYTEISIGPDDNIILANVTSEMLTVDDFQF